ncbi:hypothetical protein KFE25_003671 [Diacronema lutheri]|uniref:UDP-3-O-acyl-N-acetylglucosamine deacetylase n=1 Tax=Diacronema lutheri TaxID=2081491 RepID=A0A8J5XHJ4_DIALT|nr:hypothetical protein KFE25_003671 [Diacronema lutheri]
MAALKISRAVTVCGVGLHTGEPARVRLLPARRAGITFVRADVHPPLGVRAHVDSVTDTTLSTRLGTPGRADAPIGTVEHLLAALAGMRVRACRVEVHGPELPILDGSALPWVEALREAAADGVPAYEPSNARADEDDGAGAALECVAGAEADEEWCARPLRLTAPIAVESNGASIVALPADDLSFSYAIDFAHDAPIGQQSFAWAPPACAVAAAAEFAAELAPARTFAPAAHARALQASGRRHGGGVHNALVSDGGRWLNAGPLRFANEPVRHKLLDLLGDLALCGRPLGPMRIVAQRAGHALHVELARALLRADARADAEGVARAHARASE